MTSTPPVATGAVELDCDNWLQIVRDVISEITTWTLVCSILGSFLTIVTFLVFRKIRNFQVTLILYLCVCIICAYTAINIANQPWIYDVEPLCIITALVSHFFLIALFCWTFCITFNFYQLLVRKNRETVKLQKYYHLGSWGLPIILCAFVGGFQIYGKLPGGCAPPTCYLTDPYATFGAVFLPGLIIITVNVILFYLIGREIQETLSGAPKSDQRNRKQEFRLYLSMFVTLGVSWLFGYMEASIPEKHVQLIFFCVFSFLTPAQGILIFLSQCVNQTIAVKWCGLIGKIPGCCCFNTFKEKLQRSSASSTASRSAHSRSGYSSRG